jgi:hypothetical protein
MIESVDDQCVVHGSSDLSRSADRLSIYNRAGPLSDLTGASARIGQDAAFETSGAPAAPFARLLREVSLAGLILNVSITSVARARAENMLWVGRQLSRDTRGVQSVAIDAWARWTWIGGPV